MAEGEQSTNMNLTVRIHDIEYKANIAQGITFSEEYNETLDSGAVRISHIPQIKNLKPYDDVYIYESGDGDDYFDKHIALWRQGGGLHDGDEEGIPFYRHLLVDRFSEDVINLSQGIYSYAIELFSETKGLETIQLPNISVTQPLNISKKIDIYTYLVRFTKLYSPKYKTIARKSSNENAWTYTQKYTVAPELKSIFGGVYCQDFTLSNPTFRDLLSTLMVTLDMIPYVKDNVIYAKAISKRTKSFDMETEKNEGRVSKIVGQMASDDYCDGVRRQYSDALSQDGTCNFVEYLGFRNKNQALMTIDNMHLETTHKIYKVNKFYMCYYKRASVINLTKHTTKKIWFFCKQDITPLIKNQAEWGVLKQDWRDLDNPTAHPTSIYELAQYKLGTVSYSIGGNSIDGWGTRYQEYDKTLLNAYDITKTYIENIIGFVDYINPLGQTSQDELKEFYTDDSNKNDNIYFFPDNIKQDYTAIPNFDCLFNPGGEEVEDKLSGPQILKTIFFEIEYSGFYDGALIHTRDNGNDNIYQNDNVSSSLTLLEKDGFAQKEKLNRFANKTHIINGRLDGENYSVSKLLKLGNTCKIGNDDDVIIYRREYSIYNNYIIVSYAGIQDYVLKNFYTSVYARYRTNQLMSYGESTNRSETRKVMLILSKDKKFKDEDTLFRIVDSNGQRIESKEFFSAFDADRKNSQINTAIVRAGDGKDYFVDSHTFTSGNNLCFNIAMDDNASGGNYISTWSSAYGLLLENPSKKSDYYVGSKQEWYDIVDDDETGAIKDMSFEVNNTTLTPSLIVDSRSNALEIYNFSKALPMLTQISSGSIIKETKNSIVIEQEDIYKDNKERINMTIQVEPISNEQNDIVFGDYFVKLSNLASDSNDKYKDNETVYKNLYIPGSNIKFDFNFDVQDQVRIIINENNAYIQKIINYVRYKGNNVPFSLSFSFSFGKQYYNFAASSIGYSGNGTVGRNTNIILNGTGSYSKMTTSGIENGVIDSLTLRYTTDSYNLGIEFSHQGEISNFSKTGVIYEEKRAESTINQNMFVQYDAENYIDKTYIYKILPYDINKDEYFVDKKPSEVFQIIGDGDESKIHVNLEGVPEGTKSVNYWYFDFKSAYKKDYSNNNYIYSYAPEQSGYRFVFGVNVTPEDIARGYIDIYITKTTNRDERVFDSVGRQVGIVHNCVDENGHYDAPTYQMFDPLPNNPKMVAFKADQYLEHKLYPCQYHNFVGEIETLAYEGKQFVAWVNAVTKEEIKLNPYRLFVQDNQPDIKLKVKMYTPIFNSAKTESTTSTSGQITYTLTVEITNPNEVQADAYCIFTDANHRDYAFWVREIKANTMSTATIILPSYMDAAVDWRLQGRFVANEYSASEYVDA